MWAQHASLSTTYNLCDELKRIYDYIGFIIEHRLI